MTLPEQIANQLRQVYSGGNWTGANLKDKLEDVTWQQATTRVDSCHPIATLVFHMNYFVTAVLKVLQGGPLDAHDKFSFDHPPVKSQEDWDALVEKTWTDAEAVAALIEQLPESQLADSFADGKYGTWFRNLTGLVEHCHYHLGQIAIIRQIIQQTATGDK